MGFCSAILVLILLTSFMHPKVTRILVVTGGHDFDHENFTAMFKSFQDIEFYEVTQPEANNLYACDSIDSFDALVFYDMVQEISGEQKSAMVGLLEKGKGMVFLHHSVASYQDWKEFRNILGGCYHLAPWVHNGDSMPASTFLDDQEIGVRIADDRHPVTAGLSDFIIHDETYDLAEILPGVHPLLATDKPGSMPLLAWANRFGNSRIVYIQLGHDNHAYSNPNYRKLVRQAIGWVK